MTSKHIFRHFNVKNVVQILDLAIITTVTTFISLILLFVYHPKVGNPSSSFPESDFIVESLQHSGFFKITTSDGQITLVTSGPFLRVGRKPTVAEHRAYFSNKKKYWWPFTLNAATLLQRTATKKPSSTLIFAHYEFTRPDSESQKIHLKIWMDVYYRTGGPRSIKTQLSKLIALVDCFRI